MLKIPEAVAEAVVEEPIQFFHSSTASTPAGLRFAASHGMVAESKAPRVFDPPGGDSEATTVPDAASESSRYEHLLVNYGR